MLDKHGVTVKLSTQATAAMLGDFDEVVVATGVTPRKPDIPGIGHPSCVSYVDILSGKVRAGRRVAIIGAGGIGFDVAEFLSSPPADIAMDARHFLADWGVDRDNASPGGVAKPAEVRVDRQIVMLQRKPGRMGRGLGVSTGWVLRLALAKRRVAQMTDVTYRRIDDEGLHVTVGAEEKTIPVDTVVICAGQDEERGLYDDLVARGVKAHRIGGADKAAELDAMRAIDQGTRLAYAL
jgi:2,4-dienoyl-CoA reductase (NADPH2)